MSGICEQLSTSQKLSVEILDSLQNVQLGSDVVSEPSALAFEISEIIGAASQNKVIDGAGVNLLPEEIKNTMEFAAKKPLLMIAALCLALAPWPAFFGLKQLGSGYYAVAEATKTAAKPLIERQSQIEENTEQAIAISHSIQLIEGLKDSKTNWIQFLAQLQSSLGSAEDAWLDALSVERDEAEDGVATYGLVLQGQMLVRGPWVRGSSTKKSSRRIRSLSSFESSDFIVSSEPPVINWSSLRNVPMSYLLPSIWSWILLNHYS